MAANPTPDRLEELLAAGEDLADGLQQHAAALQVKQNTEAVVRAELDALRSAFHAFNAATGAQPAAYAALRIADSNAKGFIARAVKVLSIALGNVWSQEWEATGLPNQSTGVPRTQDDRFTALDGLRSYFAANPSREVPALAVTAAIAQTLFNNLSINRAAVANALTAAKARLLERDAADTQFRRRFRSAVDELALLLPEDDPRWYDFGLNRPADPATPGQPANVQASASGPGTVLVLWDGARRANSFNLYRQVLTVDPEPVKVVNTEGTQFTVTALPSGQTVRLTVTGVNAAGEGPASSPVDLVVA